MPEEINRVVTDHLADNLFVTEESGAANLHQEGISREKIFLVGNTMIDSLLSFQDRANESGIVDHLGLISGHGQKGGKESARRYALLTLHRPANVDEAGLFSKS